MKGKNRNKTKYVARTTTKPKRKKKGSDKKLHDFKSKGQSEKVNIELIKMEKSKYKQKNIIYSIMAVSGGILLILEIKDDLMLFEGFGIRFTGSLVGILIVIISAIGLMRNNVKAEVKN